VRKRTPVVLVHHPITNPTRTMKRVLTGLNDAALLWSTIEHVPRALLLHGHLHQRIQRLMRTSTGKVHSVGATSASLEHEDDSKMAGFNLYEIADDGAIGRVEAHVLDPKSNAFQLTSVPKLMM
jgi:hypothetical protein